MKLYEISKAYEVLTDFIEETDQEEGAFAEALKEIEDQFDVKAENLVKIIKNLEAEAEALKTEGQRLISKSKARSNRADYWKKYLLDNMQAMKLERLQAGLFDLKTVENQPAVFIEDESKIPKKFTSKEIVIKIDKNAIKEAIKSGLKVKGAELRRGTRLQIK